VAEIDHVFKRDAMAWLLHSPWKGKYWMPKGEAAGVVANGWMMTAVDDSTEPGVRTTTVLSGCRGVVSTRIRRPAITPLAWAIFTIRS